MNIAFTHVVFPGGGAERITIDIAKSLHKGEGDYRFFVYTNDITEELLTEEVSSHFIAVRKVSKNRKVRAAEIEKFIKDDGIDILIEVAARVPGIEGIRERTGCMVIFANHGEPFWQRYSILAKKSRSYMKWRLYRRWIYEKLGWAKIRARKLSRKDYNKCDIYTVLCEKYKIKMCKGLRIKPQSSHIVAINNSEHPVEHIRYDKDKTILFCGRLENVSKRIDRLLRIWGKIQNEIPDWKLVIVGDGPHRDIVEEQIRKEGLERVYLEGRTSNVSPYYKKASIVCLTSQTEGWPLCLTEAQAHGCIPVAFGCSDGVREILSPSGTHGFVVTPFDEDEYAQTLLQIIAMDESAQLKIRQNVVRKSGDFAPDVIAAKWKTLFDYLYLQKIKK